MSERQNTLIINRSDSKCGNCGHSCNPYDPFHETIYGYGEANGTPGCGVVWTHVGSDYVGPDVETWCRSMRPDLIFVGWT